MSLFRKLKSFLGPCHDESSAPPRRTRLGIEALEDRLTPIVGPNVIPMPVPASEWTGVVQINGGSGTLLSSGRHVLTAAHVVDQWVNGQIAPSAANIMFEVAGRSPVFYSVPASAVRLHPGYNGDAIGNGSDLAIVTLPDIAPVTATRHGVFRGSDEVGRWFYVAGYGTTGTAASGSDDFFDGLKRAGTNYFDDTDDRGNAPNDSLLELDMDSNAGNWAPALTEVMVAPGDSGGPSFLWGPTGLEVAGVTSFGDSGDTTYGHDAAVTRVSRFTGWVDQQMAGSYDLVLDMTRQPDGGNGVADTITVDMNGSTVVVSVNGRVVHQDSDANVNAVRILGSSDADTVYVNRTSGGAPVTIDGRGGDASHRQGAGDLDALGGAVSVIGGTGTDTITLRDDATTYNDAYTVTANSVTRSFFAGLTYSGVEGVTLNAQQGNNTVSINSTAAGTPFTVNGYGGNDTVNVGSGNLDSLGGRVTVNGGTGSDVLIVRDNTATFSDAYTITANSVTRPVFGGLTYGGVEGLTLNAQTGNNTITISSTTAATPVNVNGGGGSDTLVGSNIPSTWFLGANLTGGVGMVNFAGVERLRGGTANDTFRFTDVASAWTSIDGGLGTDTLDYSANPTGLLGAGVNVDLTAGTTRSLWNSTIPVAGIENATGTQYADGLYGNASANLFRGGGGNDTLSGLGGSDTLYGDADHDLLYGGIEADTLSGGTGNDVMFGGAGADTLSGGDGDDLLIGGSSTLEAVFLGVSSVRNEWNSARSYSDRVRNLRGDATSPTFASRSNGNNFLTATTVPDDGAADTLVGDAGSDWFWGFANDVFASAVGEMVR